MKLDLDFSLYKGTTQLKSWWKAVKSHFTQVQEANNELDAALETEISNREQTDAALSAEVTNRTNADTALQKKITDETSARANADAVLDGRIGAEITARVNADNTLQQNIDTETADRASADSDLQQKIAAETSARISYDNAFDVRISAVEQKAHTHANKSVLDGISASDIAAWDGIKEQVSKTQLDEVIAAEKAERTEGDSLVTAALEAVKAYFEEICFGFSDEFQRIYNAIGVTVYDGGLFGAGQSDIALDGGDFADETAGTVDCGGFELLTADTVEINGGTY